MSTDPSRFRPIDPPPDDGGVEVVVDGQPLCAPEGQTLLGVLLGHGLLALRDTERRGLPRGAFCGMGVCMDCLVMLEGVGLVRACAERVRPGMVVRTRWSGEP